MGLHVLHLKLRRLKWGGGNANCGGPRRRDSLKAKLRPLRRLFSGKVGDFQRAILDHQGSDPIAGPLLLPATTRQTLHAAEFSPTGKTQVASFELSSLKAPDKLTSRWQLLPSSNEEPAGNVECVFHG